MRQKLAILAAITLLLISAKSVRTVRLTVINKSGLPVEVRLTGTYYEETYYLRVPEGDRDHASEAHIDVLPDDYSMQVFYKEYWDPVYGYDCSEGGKNIKLTHSSKAHIPGVQLSDAEQRRAVFTAAEVSRRKKPLPDANEDAGGSLTHL